MKFYLTNSSSPDNIINILKTGILKPGGGEGMSTSNEYKSEYLYFELIFSTFSRKAHGNCIYYDYHILKDYDFYYTDNWGFLNDNKSLGKKFPKKNIYKELKLLEKKWINKKKKGSYSYQFVTKLSIPINKYIRFVSNPMFIYPPWISKANLNFNKEKKIIELLLNNNYKNGKLLNYYDKIFYNELQDDSLHINNIIKSNLVNLHNILFNKK